LAEPKVTVIIPTYNREDLLRLTLASLCTQGIEKKSFEIIVCDDGSSDGTRALVENYGESNLRYLYQPNMGFRLAAARNLGIRAARAPICAFIDCGMLAGPNFVEEHLASHLSRSDSVAVVGSIVGLDQQGFPHDDSDSTAIQSLIEPSNIARSIEQLEKAGFGEMRETLFYQRFGGDPQAWPAPWTILWGGNVSVPTTVLNEVGLFDEAFVGWGGEDMDLGVRLVQHGVAIVVNRDAKAIHYPHSQAMAGIPFAQQEARRREIRLYIHSKHQRRDTRLAVDHMLVDLNAVLLEEGSDAS